MASNYTLQLAKRFTQQCSPSAVGLFFYPPLPPSALSSLMEVGLISILPAMEEAEWGDLT